MNNLMRPLLGASLLMAICAPSLSDPIGIDEVTVIGERNKRIYELAESLHAEPDSASLLRKVVGANIISNGPLTGMAQYRGMSRFRVSTQINGAIISSGGPNWMDPPLSYAPAAHLETIEVYRGISNVSAGAETIGGAIKANTWQGSFSDSDASIDGRFRAASQSVNSSQLLSGAVVLSNQSHLLKVSGLSESADDAAFAKGDILPTEYQRQRYDLGYGFRSGDHTFRIDYGRSETGDTGTPALPMDIVYIDADLMTASWIYSVDNIEVTSKLHRSKIEHGMTNYHLRQAPVSPAMWRRNIAEGENLGFSTVAALGTWSVGFDYHDEQHDSNIDNPNNPMFFVQNFVNADRTLAGIYVQREWLAADAWWLEIGARYNRVTMDADPVNATPAVLGMPPAIALRDTFNNADRSVTDNNFDWVLKASYPTSDELTYYAGLSRKTRSPAYQERYLWLPLQATAGLADGRTYTGNLNLDPEVAHELELGFDWQNSQWEISPRIFYKSVSDYIQGTASSVTPAVMFIQMMNTANGTNNPAPLQFNNVDATFYGADVDWRYTINDFWSVNGIANLIRAKRDDISDDLYRIAAPNLFFSVNYQQPKWKASIESYIYDDQNHVSATNGETKSEGYALFNLTGAWNLTEQLSLGFGVDNITDRDYQDHLSGTNRVAGNLKLAKGERLPGYGRNYYLRLDYRL